MAIAFQESATDAPNPLEGANTEFQEEKPTKPSTKLPPGFMDPNNPENTGEVTRTSREDRYAKVDPPILTWSQNEKNSFHRELLIAAEEQCRKIHDSLVFQHEDLESGDDESIYPAFEAELILEESPELNKEQLQAVLSSREDLILHALAGTGKTRSLSSMIAYLVALGTRPNKIAVCSHTVTAAQEIKARVEPMVEKLFPRINDYRGDGIFNWIQAGTIHALAYRELGRMRHPKSRHAIIEESTQIKLWKEACQFALGADFRPEEENLFFEWMRLHERIRGMALPENRVSDVLKSITKSDRLSRIAETYRKIKEARDLIDYTDLLRLWIEIIVHPGYAKRWKYVFVDEYQDTSPLQKFILKIFRNQGVKVIVCGDIRQSITSFTGSDPAIQNPLETLPGPFPAKELWLQVNYRCSAEIIGLANEILRNMFPEEKHRLMAHHQAPEGTATRITQIPGKTHEFSCTIAEGMEIIERLKAKGNERPSVALLYRTNAQGSKLEETIAEMNTRMIKKGLAPITYTRKDYRRTALRNRTERELGAILHAWSNPQRGRWFEVLTSPYFPGIGEVTANTITSKASRKKPKTIGDAWGIFEGEIPKKSLEIVGKFLTAWERSAALLTEDESLETIPTNTAVENLRQWIQEGLANSQERNSDTISKKEIEESQRRSYEVSYFEKLLRLNQPTLKEALQKLEEETRKEEEFEGSETPEGLILSTIHLAKGREFDGVVLHNVSWFSLPHFNAIQQEEFADNILERRWRKLCSLEAENLEEDENLFQEAIRNPEAVLPRIVPYPKEASWGKSENELEEDGEEEAAHAPNHSVAWDWMTNPIEEEKRLLYVGVTRARQELVITTTSKKSHPFIPAGTWWALQEGKMIAKPQEREQAPTSTTTEEDGDQPF